MLTGCGVSLVGGAKGEDKYWGLPCTISLAAKRTTSGGETESGVIIPDHCNQKTTTYYQPSNDNKAYKIGNETKDGGWFCDCDFIKSDSRAIDGNKIHTNASEITLNGRADLKKGDMVRMYGGVSGLDEGMILAVNQWRQLGGQGHWFTDLYTISGIEFTDGDSGAPIVGDANTKYAGMNIAGSKYGSDYNYGHGCTFLKDKLNLK